MVLDEDDIQCSFCSFVPPMAQGPSYGEVFEKPFREMEIMEGLVQLENMQNRLDQMEQELHGIISAKKKRKLC